MTWRIVSITNMAKLDYRLGQMVIRGEEVHRIHLSELHTLIVESTAVSLTAALLAELIKRKVKVIFCDESRNPLSELISYSGSHDSSGKIRQQIRWSEDTKGEVWKAIVHEKITNQMQVLVEANKREQEKTLFAYRDEIELHDLTNREGHAAKVYFNALFGLSFSRAQPIPINAFLNYGYSILLACVNREIVANGCLTQIGIHHDNAFNPFNFGSDLVEPFRPLVDHLVLSVKPRELGKAEKLQLISLLSKKVNINGKDHFLTNAIQIYVKSVIDALNENDPSLLTFCRYEL